MKIVAKMKAVFKFNGKVMFAMLIIMGFLFSQCRDSAVPPPEDSRKSVRELNSFEKKIVQSDNIFGFKIFNKIVQSEKDNNIFIAPASMSFALAMALNGANGITREEMQSVLELQGLSLEEIDKNFKSMIDLLENIDSKVQFQIANSIWHDLRLNLEEEFLNDCVKYFYSEVKGMDFTKAEVPDIINAWVEKNTNGKIKEIIDKIEPAVVLYIINAIYFKGTWTYRFEEKNTIDAPFYSRNGSGKNCKMMNQSARYLYYEDNNLQAIDLPYGQNGFSMTVLLPRQGVDINNFISGINSEVWNNLLSKFTRDSVNLYLPKFKMEYEIMLNDALKSLGMVTAFSGNADFTRMYKPGGLSISRVKHKTFIDVNEEGTEAAGVTVIEFRNTSVNPQVVTMCINRPFIFVIRENNTQNILFIGKIVDPNY